MAAPVEVIVIGDGNRVQMQIGGGPVVEEVGKQRKTGWENDTRDNSNKRERKKRARITPKPDPNPNATNPCCAPCNRLQQTPPRNTLQRFATRGVLL